MTGTDAGTQSSADGQGGDIQWRARRGRRYEFAAFDNWPCPRWKFPCFTILLDTGRQHIVIRSDMPYNIALKLSDVELVAEVLRLVRGDRDSMVLLLTHLAELGSRKLHLAAGYRSLFAYCTHFLRLSEHEAFHRILAARTARRFPRILERLGDGRLNLTTVKLLAPHLTAENEAELLDVASGNGNTRRQVEVLVAERFPQPDVPASVRRLPAAKVAAPLSLPVQSSTPAVAPASPRPAVVQPTARDRYEVRFTTTAEAVERLQLAQDMLGHAVPDGDLAAVVDRAVVALLEKLAAAKYAATPRPRPGRGTDGDSRHVPANVKRQVWIRDTGRCAFVAERVYRCDARRFLEFHHLKPYAEGGQATVENMQLRCRAHNGYEAHVYYDASRTARAEGLVTESHARYGPSDHPRTRPGPSSVMTRGLTSLSFGTVVVYCLAIANTESRPVAVSTTQNSQFQWSRFRAAQK